MSLGRLVEAFLSVYAADGECLRDEAYTYAPLAWMRVHQLGRLHIRHQKSNLLDPMRRFWIHAIGRELGRTVRDL